MDVKKLNNKDLIRQYEQKTVRKSQLNREINELKELIIDRIIKSETDEIRTPTRRVYIKYIPVSRVKSIIEIENAFGEEWIDKNRRRLLKLSETKKIKIEPLD